MKKIGLLTSHAAHNYGSMLQAFALQKALEGMGHNVWIINLRTSSQNFLYVHPLQYWTFRRAQSALFHPILLLSNVRKWYFFERFLTSSLKLTQEIRTLTQTLELIDEEKFDAVITGGDQIWNMTFDDFIVAYYLPFNIKGIKKISYAPSLGSGEYWNPERCSYVIKNLLSDYDVLSVREKKGSNFLTGLLGRVVPVMPDPTFLISKEIYYNLAGDRPIVKGHYCFYYSPVPDKEIERVCIDYATRKRLPIITSTGESDHCIGMKRKQAVGPLEFLNLILFADAVCGKSFHLITFALIFNKPFLAVTGNTDYRIKSLLDMLSLNGRACEKNADVSQMSLPEIDWDEVNKKLQSYKTMGLDFLSNALM